MTFCPGGGGSTRASAAGSKNRGAASIGLVAERETFSHRSDTVEDDSWAWTVAAQTGLPRCPTYPGLGGEELRGDAFPILA